MLTAEGWKPWPKVDGTEVFGTLNPVSHDLDIRGQRRSSRRYAGPMYRVQSEQVDLLVTQSQMWSGD